MEKYIKEKAIEAIKNINQNELKDMYVFSFFVYDDMDDPRRPTLQIGYNTLTNLKNEAGNIDDADEEKWNYAFWLQNEIALIGTLEDESGRNQIQNWVHKNGLNYSEQEDYDSCIKKGNKITTSFIETLIKIVQEIHSSKLTDLPILIHELEYYDTIKEQNIRANGDERVKEFTKWINKWIG